MDNTVLIVLIIGVVIIAVVFMLRDRITRFGARASLDKREGGVDIEAVPPTQNKRQTASPHAINISGNKLVGKKNVIEVERSDVNVQDNMQLGEDQRITAKSEPERKKK